MDYMTWAFLLALLLAGSPAAQRVEPVIGLLTLPQVFRDRGRLAGCLLTRRTASRRSGSLLAAADMPRP